MNAPNLVRRITSHPSRTFFRFLLAYCLVLSVPCLLALSLYSGLVQRTESYVSERTISGLRQTQNVVDQYLEQMRWNAIRISENAKLRMILTAARAGDPIRNITLREVIDVLFDDIAYKNDLTTTCNIYIKNASLLLTPDTVYSPEFYYGHVIRAELEGETIDWHAEASSQYVPGRFFQSMIIEFAESNRRISVIPFVQSLPAGYNREPEGYIAYLINADTVRDLLAQVAVADDGWMCIVDSNDKVLSSIHRSPAALSRILPVLDGETGIETRTISGEQMVLMFVTSESNGWRYIAAFPASFARDLIPGVRRATWLSFGFIVAVGLVCACLFASRDSKPIDALFRLVRETFSGEAVGAENRYSHVDRAVSKIIRRNWNLQHTLQVKTDYLQTLFFERLLKGRIPDRDSLNTMFDRADIRIDASLYVVALIKIEAQPVFESQTLIDEIQSYREYLHATVMRQFDCPCLLHILDEHTTLLLIGMESSDADDAVAKIENWIERVFDLQPDMRPASVIFAGGEPVHDLLEVHGSYEQALEALGYASKGDRIVWFSSVGKNTDDFYYPLELESRLLRSIQAGDRAAVERALSAVWQHNHQTRSLPLETRRALLTELHGTLRKLRLPADGNRRIIGNTINAAESNLTIDAAFDHLRGCVLTLCDEIHEHQSTRAHELARAISVFLDERYKDPELSLYQIAAHFGLTEAYVSAFFKNHIGSNISRYIESLRLDRAARYLSETNFSVKAIAIKVGYGSDKAFRRAFKRANGVAPVDFRLRERASPHNV